MKVAASIFDAEGLRVAEESGADLIEFRLDLAEERAERIGRQIGMARLPVILTLRSAHEGGRFRGGSDAWFRTIEPLLGIATYVDVERRFRKYADRIRSEGAEIIASVHTGEMPARDAMEEVEGDLRSYGDIPKIVVNPLTLEDLLDLLAFTLRAKRPICTGTCGERFRYSRLLLPLFGSEIVYCHTGRPTGEGQYHIREWKRLYSEIFGDTGGRNVSNP